MSLTEVFFHQPYNAEEFLLIQDSAHRNGLYLWMISSSMPWNSTFHSNSDTSRTKWIREFQVPPRSPLEATEKISRSGNQRSPRSSPATAVGNQTCNLTKCPPLCGSRREYKHHLQAPRFLATGCPIRAIGHFQIPTALWRW